jgi:hypothetical protein
MSKTHNRKYYVLAGIIVITILTISLFVFIIMPIGKPIVLHESEFLFKNVKDGDIICRFGDRLWSQFFKDVSITDKRYSHMGIIRINNKRVTVIHAEGTTELGKDFVKEESLEDFIKIARAIGIYRVNNIDSDKISDLAIEYIGLPFDWQFDMDDESKLYCTELLYVVLKRITPIFELNTNYVKELGKNIIPLDAISKSEYFSEIYFISSEK